MKAIAILMSILPVLHAAELQVIREVTLDCEPAFTRSHAPTPFVSPKEDYAVVIGDRPVIIDLKTGGTRTVNYTEKDEEKPWDVVAVTEWGFVMLTYCDKLISCCWWDGSLGHGGTPFQGGGDKDVDGGWFDEYEVRECDSRPGSVLEKRFRIGPAASARMNRLGINALHGYTTEDGELGTLKAGPGGQSYVWDKRFGTISPIPLRDRETCSIEWDLTGRLLCFEQDGYIYTYSSTGTEIDKFEMNGTFGDRWCIHGGWLYGLCNPAKMVAHNVYTKETHEVAPGFPGSEAQHAGGYGIVFLHGGVVCFWSDDKTAGRCSVRFFKDGKLLNSWDFAADKPIQEVKTERIDDMLIVRVCTNPDEQWKTFVLEPDKPLEDAPCIDGLVHFCSYRLNKRLLYGVKACGDQGRLMFAVAMSAKSSDFH